MAQNRKKKKKQGQKSPDIRKRILNKTFVDKAYTAIKKILRAYDLDPDMFDRLSKYQRHVFMLVETESPRFKVAEGCRVPRQLVTLVNNSTHHFLRNNYYGDRSIGLTYLELATFGIGFYNQIMAVHAPDDRGFPPEQMKIVDAIAEKFIEMPVRKPLEAVGAHIRKTVQMISKVNFRIYGYDWKITSGLGTGSISSTVILYAEESEFVHFPYKGKYHKAFRVKAGRVISMPSHGAKIDEWFINRKGTDADESKYVDIYIQSHALQRIKERVDIFAAHRRNFYVMDPLMYMQRVVFNSRRQAMFECYCNDVLFGYYPFTMQGDKLFVLSFLPVTALDTPTGEALAEELKLQKEDIIYLGMDKLSFFFTIDFKQVPDLYRALVNAGLGALLSYSSDDRLPFELDLKKTLRVKRFFENAAALREVGDEI